MDFYTNPVVIFVAAILLAVVGLITASKRKPKVVESQAIEEAERVARENAVTKCECGKPATHPAPTLERGRGTMDFLRKLFAAPPRFTRVVNHMLPPTLCSSHAHVADTAVDKWRFNMLAEIAASNERIATSAANFEQEFLAKAIYDSLTEAQKQAKRKATSPLRAVSSIGDIGNGTTGG